MKDGFDQLGYKVYFNLKTVLFNTASVKEFDAEFDEAMKLY